MGRIGRVQRAVLVLLGLIALALIGLFALPVAMAATVLLSLYLIRGLLRGNDTESLIVPEGLPPGAHWLVIDSPLGIAAAEHVCRSIDLTAHPPMSIVLDLRGISTVDGLSTTRLLDAVRTASPRIVVVGNDNVVRDFLNGEIAGSVVHVHTAPEAVAQLRTWCERW